MDAVLALTLACP